MNRSLFWISCLFTLSSLTACGGGEEDANADTTPQQDMAGSVEDMATDTPDAADELDMGAAPEDQGQNPSQDQGDVPDASSPEDMGEEADIEQIGDLSQPVTPEDFPCFEELEEAWPYNSGVNATAMLSVTDEGGAIRATLDASAGGSMSAPSQAFVYLDLDSATLLELDDYTAYADTRWDLAFKRVVIRSNSGSSGTGAASVARLADTTFEAVTEAPAQAEYWQDLTADETCQLTVDPIMTPYTAFNFLNGDNPTGSESWYSYGGPGGISPLPGMIYLVKNAEGTQTFKLELISWMSGVYEVRWAPLQ